MNDRPDDTRPDDRVLTEVMLLGGLLLGSNVSYRTVQGVLDSPELWFDPLHAHVFGVIGEAVDSGLDGFRRNQWIAGQLRDSVALKELGWTPWQLISRYCRNAAPEIGLEGCARQIRYDYLRTELDVATLQGDLQRVESVAAEMDRLSKHHLTKDEGIESIAQLSDRLLEKLNEAYKSGKPVADYAHCGSDDLGKTISGWRRKKFYVIAGRPGMGKSTAALSLLLRTAQKGSGVMFFALEMGREELTEMALCSLAWSHDHRIEYRDISSAAVGREGFSDKFERVIHASRKLAGMPFFIGDRGGLTVGEIRSQAHQYAQRLEAEGKRLDVIVIDHMGHMRASDRYAGNKVSETEEISTGLKMLAKELNCAVIALAQINRGVEGRDDKRPVLADLRWSGSIEQDADVVIFIYRESYYLERTKHDTLEEEEVREVKLGELRSRIELIISKNRGGPTGNVEMFCDIGCAVIRDSAVAFGGTVDPMTDAIDSSWG